MAAPALAEYPDDCLGLDEASGIDCMDLTDIGCCDDVGRVVWCESGQLYCLDCANGGPECGWDPDASFYNCGTDGAADPSGDNPIDCVPVCDPDCTDGQVCILGECCTPDCADKTCGDDGCEGSCGECGAGQFCNESSACEELPVCQQAAEPVSCDETIEGTTVGATSVLNGYSCSSWDESGPEIGYLFTTDYLAADVTTDNVTVTVEFEGEGDLDIFALEGACTIDSCVDGSSSKVEVDVTTGNSYFFVVDGFDGTEGPFTMKVACLSTCVISCSDGPCSDDGCKGVCPCESEVDVCFAGECCTPSCDGVECGDDGCGGSCAECADGFVCTDGVCEESSGPVECLGLEIPSSDDCMGLGYEGCCDEQGRVLWCQDGALFCIDCTQGEGSCGWKGEFYDCGTDGSEDPTGAFPIFCDGTGGCDPACAAGEKCVGGECVACEPDCAGKACGDDGCGGSCGECAGEGICANGLCNSGPGCAIEEGPGCGGCPCEACVCALDAFCCDTQYDQYCVDACIGECGGCATDPVEGCGDGACADEEDCGSCPADCGCEAGLACEAGACVEVICEVDCADKVCGDDGCGGSCGECADGVDCVAGQCGGCVQDCAGKECGDDGCGGSCGVCEAGMQCNDGICGSGVADVVTGADVPGNTDVTDDAPKDEKSGCTTGGSGNPLALMLFLSMLFAIVVIRRVRA